MWHRRETRRLTEKTNFALPSGECPVYSKPHLYVTRRSCAELGLTAGLSIWIQIKAVALL
jgi:hypothetical protein